MADLSGVTTNYIPTANEVFTDTLSASCAALDATVYVTNLAEYTDGDIVVLTVDPGTANEATFTGVKASAPYRVTNCKWTEGNLAVGHNSGATIIDYDSATHYNMLAKALKQIMNQNGTLITAAVQAALGLAADSLNGWNALGYAPNSIVDNGNGSYTATINSVDLTGTTAVGQKMLLPRAATATQCATFDGINDYFSKVSPNKMAFTDDFVASAWVKPSATSVGTVIARYNGSSGYVLRIGALGSGNQQIQFVGFNTASANYSCVVSTPSVTLNRWSHIASLLDMSAFTAAAGTAETAKSWIMINGVEVHATVLRGGTNPTAIIQAGDLTIGQNNASEFFTGKMAQVAIYNTRVTQATIRASRNQPLTGSETNLASAYSFNNSITDLNTTTPNDLTANGGVVATTADTPFTNPVTGTNLTAGTRNYAIIMAQTFSTNTVYTLQVAEGETIPTTTPPTSLSYSGQKAPYGFPVQDGKWDIITDYINMVSTFGAGIAQLAGGQIHYPIGNYKISVELVLVVTSNPLANGVIGLGTTTSAYMDLSSQQTWQTQVATIGYYWTYKHTRDIDASSAGILYLNRTGSASITSLSVNVGRVILTPSGL